MPTLTSFGFGWIFRPLQMDGNPFRHGSLSGVSRVVLVSTALLGCLGSGLPGQDTIVVARPVEVGTPPLARRLSREGSPFLLQHANDPVDWYTWGPEALERAQLENKPIFLSIGYQSCHACHLMQRLVFSDPEIAAFMNSHFINIQVDCEERPDLSETYLLALQVYLQKTGSGPASGWPVSMFLTPAGNPIAGGTSFPPRDLADSPGFLSVLKQVQEAWKTRRQEVLATSELLSNEVAHLSSPAFSLAPVELSGSLVTNAARAVVDLHDAEWGGFASPPGARGEKFPDPCRLQLLQTLITGDSTTAADDAALVDLTLDKMADGGLRDHLGGGFHRSSTDRAWQLPHFEKRLHDNVLLAEVYLDAWRRTGREYYRRVVLETLEFLQRDLLSPTGGFRAAVDAECEGVNGAFYTWKREEIEQLLSPRDFQLFAAVYGLNDRPSLADRYLLRLSSPLEETAGALGVPVKEFQTRLGSIRAQLLAARNQRPLPPQDTLILTGWNGLAVRAFARAGHVLKQPELIAVAQRTALRLLSAHRDARGRLLRTEVRDSANVPGFLEDYAFVVSGLLQLHAVTGEDKWLLAARRLTDEQISLFWDARGQGFYFTGNDQPVVLARGKFACDGSVPAGNSVSAQNLMRLAVLTSSEPYRDLARDTLAAFAGQLETSPDRMSCLALAVQEYRHQQSAQPLPVAGGQLFADDAPQLAQRPPRPVPTSESPPAEEPLQISLKLAADEAGRHPQIKAVGYLSVDRLPAGAACRVAVEIDIANGWHINANPPHPDFVIPTQLSLKTPDGVQLEEVYYPDGKPFTVAGIDQPLSVYEGKVYLLGILTVPEGLQGEQQLSLQLRYQACNDHNCLRPMTLLLTTEIGVTPKGEKVQSRNRPLFEKLLKALPVK
ncbi:DUF255 domain-containing protein [Planctomicrobium sp. SH664]|uniref:DUF255 domain-containing protein n=1 Tax=Planctomicrobium sp. SH664 TaxID=3448125 RepID=UPI003F5B309A